MQKKPSPRSWVAAYWRKPPIKLPRCLSPVGCMPEKILISVLSLASAVERSPVTATETESLGHSVAWAGKVCWAPAPEETESVKTVHGHFLALGGQRVKERRLDSSGWSHRARPGRASWPAAESRDARRAGARPRRARGRSGGQVDLPSSRARERDLRYRHTSRRLR